MEHFAAILLGFVQGITEFLPVSSSGHLILVRDIFNISGGDALAVDAVLHFATAFAVIVYFWREITRLFHVFLRMLGRQLVDEKDRALVMALILGTIPAVVAGLSLENLMETTFRSPILVATVLILGSLLFVFAEYSYNEKQNRAVVTGKIGFFIGLFQTLALIPGMSRSGVSISGGLLLGLSRIEATRFAFLLAVPLMVGAGGKKLFELMSSDTAIPFSDVLVGALVAFSVGLLAIRFMLRFVRRHTLWPFVWYRLALATVVLFWAYF